MLAPRVLGRARLRDALQLLSGLLQLRLHVRDFRRAPLPRLRLPRLLLRLLRLPVQDEPRREAALGQRYSASGTAPFYCVTRVPLD